eukprot:gene8759-10361_t
MSLNVDAIKTGGHQEYPEYMLQENQVESEENLGLFKAALSGSAADCAKFLKKGAKPNFFFRPEDHKNALHVAAEHGHTEVVKMLLEHGAEVNCKSVADQTTALTLAASHNNDANLIKVLLEHGATVNHGNGYGNTALHEACRMGHGAVINILLEHGADVNAKNHKGSTPLHMFCYGNPKAGAKDLHSRALCETLLKNGAGVNTPDNRGATPVLVCAASGRIDLLELLVARGADLHAVDGKNQNASDVATFYSQEAMVKFLSTQGFK